MAVGLGQGKSGTATAKRTGGVVVPEGVKFFDGPNGRSYDFDQGNKFVSFSVTNPGNGSPSKVDFSVDGFSLRSANRASPQDGIAIALRVRGVMNAEIASRPDGFRYVTAAARGDGLGDRRAKLYMGAGFSKPTRTGGSMYGVVKNGRLVPDKAAADASAKQQRDTLRQSGLSRAEINRIMQ